MSTNSRNRDKEMAAYLKERGIRRTSGNCPICHRGVSLNNLQNHIVTCKG